jgi:uncharacterized protein (TIGR02231 family)
MLKLSTVFALCLGLLAVAATQAAEPPATATADAAIAVKSRIDTVTVFRGQALVTRILDLPAQTGDLQIAVEDLPAAVYGSSLSASSDDTGTVVRSVQFRTRAVAAAASKEVADLDTSIKSLKQEIYANEQYQKLQDAKLTYLDRLEQFAVAPAGPQAAKGELKPEVIDQITKTDFEQRTAIVKERIDLVQKAEALKEKLALAERQRGELSRSAEKAVNSALVFITKSKAGAAPMRLQYMVGSADWSPRYNVTLVDGGKSVRLEYLADIQQMSGEDWSGVRLTLSTATPQLAAETPVLGPLWINLIAPSPASTPGSGPGMFSFQGYAKAQENVRIEQRKAAVNIVVNKQDMSSAGWDLNRWATESQYLDLNASVDAVRSGLISVTATEEGLAVSYPLDGKMNLASRSERQLVEIKRFTLTGKTYYEASPLLTGYVGRNAEIINSGALPLLAGSYNAYIDGEFVGTGNLPVVAQGQTFVVGFGVDTQLRCRRELIDKADSTSWGSRVQTFHYRLRLENFKDKPVDVRLMDRIPASKTEDVKISLEKTATPLATDEVYVRDYKPAGILRWDIALPGSSFGAKAKDLDYTFEVRFAKDKAVGWEVKPAEQQMQADYFHAAAAAKAF